MLKSISVLLFFILLFIIELSCLNSNHEAKKNADTSEIYKEQKIEEENKIQEYVLPKEFSYFKLTGNNLYDRFFPIGWSKDGKIAFIYEPADEASGMYFFELHVYNTENNKIEWSWKSKPLEKASCKSIWENNYKQFHLNLNKFKIIQQNNFELQNSSIKRKQKEYTLNLLTNYITDKYGLGINVVNETSLVINELKAVSKTIFILKENNSRYLSATLCGYLKSPYSEHIAVITRFERIGYEGPPHVLIYKITGVKF